MNLTVPSFPLSPAFCRMPVGVPMPELGVAGLVGDCFTRPFGAGMPFITLPFVSAVSAAATAYPAGSAVCLSCDVSTYSVYRGIRRVDNSSLREILISRKESTWKRGPIEVRGP